MYSAGMRPTHLALTAALISLAAPASADWQYTQWGMSPEQVVSAAQGNAESVRGLRGDQVRGQELGAEGTYSASGMTFRTQFYFSPLSGGLSAIRLHPEAPEACEVIEREIDGIYSRAGRSEYVSTERNLRVRVSNGYGQCFLLYTPIAPTNETGL